MNKLWLLGLLLATQAAFPQDEDDTQPELRLNPEIESSDSAYRTIDANLYPFLHPEANKIELNGDDWNALANKFAAASRGDSLFSIVYLGDSHVQADFGGDILRTRLTDASRKAGRGIIIPYRLAATNQPNDYKIQSSASVVASKLLKQPWRTEMPFTGIGVRPSGKTFGVDISSRMAFSRMRIFYIGDTPQVGYVTSDGTSVHFETENTEDGEITLSLDRSLCCAKVDLEGGSKTVYGGFEILGDTIGTVLHSIGNNGATYGSYNSIDGFGAGIRKLHPDLVIIALGTNEAFGSTTAEDMVGEASVLIADIRRQNPGTKFMIVTPTECYKKTYRYVRRSKNSRRRRVTNTVVNTKVMRMRDALRNMAVEEGVPLYDHYSVAGGTGAAANMKKAGLLGRDGVHMTVAGYQLFGGLLADALLARLCSPDDAEGTN